MTGNPKILITGANGQLGAAVRSHAAALGLEAVGLARSDCDITAMSAVRRCIESIKPDVVVNAAAYTDVDGAERDRHTAFAVNENGAANIARICRNTNARLVHVSTDFVFNGKKGQPYRPEDRPEPINVYGRSKLAGERAVLEHLPQAVIIRTSWLYSPGFANFVTGMLDRFGNCDELGIAGDHIGSPTCANGLAEAILAMIEKEMSGLFHWADCGVASRYDFACAIYEDARRSGYLARKVNIFPVFAQSLELPAPRPAFSALDSAALRQKLKFPAVHWRTRLRQTLVNITGQDLPQTDRV